MILSAHDALTTPQTCFTLKNSVHVKYKPANRGRTRSACEGLQTDFATMFDYLEFQAFGPEEFVDFYTTSSPACVLQDQDQDQDLSAFFPELMEAVDWQQHRCSQCRWNKK